MFEDSKSDLEIITEQKLNLKNRIKPNANNLVKLLSKYLPHIWNHYMKD